jgi:hypothetical protein
MGQDPSVIREELEQTRARVGDEVDALSYKTDVPARVGDYVDDKKQAVKDKFTSVVPDTGQMRRGASTVRDTAERNPLGLAVGGLAVGFVIGTLLPSTRIENEQMGEISDRLLETAKDTASEAVERGKQVAQEATSAAVETAKETGREQGEELATQVREQTGSQSTNGS